MSDEIKKTGPHEFQHEDDPTHCLHCGTFREHCHGEPCPKYGQRLFDGSDPKTGARMIGDLFGVPLATKASVTRAQ